MRVMQGKVTFFMHVQADTADLKKKKMLLDTQSLCCSLSGRAVPAEAVFTSVMELDVV